MEVIWMEGWKRSMYYDETGLPFIFPSVNLPTLDSVLVDPGYGMFEGIKVSEGRGTTRPFEIIGAPFIDYTLAKKLNSNRSTGTNFLEAYFTPTFKDFGSRFISKIAASTTQSTLPLTSSPLAGIYIRRSFALVKPLIY
jgi:uncharacterized protein YbbC (DUF1343 family)